MKTTKYCDKYNFDALFKDIVIQSRLLKHDVCKFRKLSEIKEAKEARAICHPIKSFKITGSKVYLHLFIVNSSS